MTVDNLPPLNPAHAPVLHAAAAALFVAILVAFGGWLHTVRELNRLSAYHAVGAEALRMLQPPRAQAAPAPGIYANKRE